jgi:transposase-like protein
LKRDLHLNAQSDSPDTTRSAADFADYFAFPRNHWRQIEINNPLERNIREIRRHIRVVGPFPDGHSALTVVAARLRDISSTKWGERRYLAMGTLLHPLPDEASA